jgi:hypothetical protein
MDISVFMLTLQLLFLAAAFSCARSYFGKGRIAGIRVATREILRGIQSHYHTAGLAIPQHIAKAIEAVDAFPGDPSSEKAFLRYRASLWTFGDALGSACWRKGFETCRARMLPREDRIRLDLRSDDLLQLAALAHLGFKKTMPNDRVIETLRFNGEQHALSAARAIDRLECALPESLRPSDHSATRQDMIRHWWPPERKLARRDADQQETAAA